MTNKGTIITAPIKPPDSGDKFPVAEAIEIKGGHHFAPTIATRNTITWERLELGMLCYVQTNGSGNSEIFSLTNLPDKATYDSNGGTLDIDWESIYLISGRVKGFGTHTAGEHLITFPTPLPTIPSILTVNARDAASGADVDKAVFDKTSTNFKLYLSGDADYEYVAEV